MSQPRNSCAEWVVGDPDVDARAEKARAALDVEEFEGMTRVRVAPNVGRPVSRSDQQAAARVMKEAVGYRVALLWRWARTTNKNASEVEIWRGVTRDPKEFGVSHAIVDFEIDGDTESHAFPIENTTDEDGEERFAEVFAIFIEKKQLKQTTRLKPRSLTPTLAASSSRSEQFFGVQPSQSATAHDRLDFERSAASLKKINPWHIALTDEEIKFEAHTGRGRRAAIAPRHTGELKVPLEIPDEVGCLYPHLWISPSAAADAQGWFEAFRHFADLNLFQRHMRPETYTETMAEASGFKVLLTLGIVPTSKEEWLPLFRPLARLLAKYATTKGVTEAKVMRDFHDAWTEGVVDMGRLYKSYRDKETALLPTPLAHLQGRGVGFNSALRGYGGRGRGRGDPAGAGRGRGDPNAPRGRGG
jgi:hypothetical protein